MNDITNDITNAYSSFMVPKHITDVNSLYCFVENGYPGYIIS